MVVCWDQVIAFSLGKICSGVSKVVQKELKVNVVEGLGGNGLRVLLGIKSNMNFWGNGSLTVLWSKPSYDC